jgi:hypothetical protein
MNECTTKEEGTAMILGFPREIKIQCMKDALEQDNFGMFMGLSKVFLDAPISEGGIETEVIKKIHDDYLAKHGVKPV